MLSLPSLAPQDSYVLWYTSSTTNHHPPAHDPSSTPENNALLPQNPRRVLPTHRTPLARLRHDEEYLALRKANISNYGTSWIKPPGIPKSLHQLREEKREMEEHQEAMRREALAQELAEAEARELEELAAQQRAQGGGGVPAQVEGAGEVEAGEGDGQRDLDDDIPDGDAETTGFGNEDDEDEDEDEDDDDDDDDEDEENDVEPGPRNTLASRIPDDVYREALARGVEVRTSRAFAEEDSNIDEEDQAQILHEEDLLPAHNGRGRGGMDVDVDMDMDMDMGVDLDADIPDGDEEAGGYEHTDTEEELTSSSSEEDEEEGGRRLPTGYPAAGSMVRSDGTQNSLDLSSVLASGSSQIGSSPRRMGELRGRRRG